MGSTINGKPVEEVIQKLKEDIPDVIKVTTDRKANPYLDAKILQNFFEEHVPVSNYDFKLSDMQFIQLHGRACFVCTGTIILYDDNKQKIVEKSFEGSQNCIISKDTGEPVDLAMDARNAGVTAKKGCITQFGCGSRQLEEAKAKNKASRDSKAGNVRDMYPAQMPGNGVGSAAIRRCPPTGKANFLLVHDGRKAIKDFQKMYLVPVLCREYGNYETTLVIWKNCCKDVTAVYNRVATDTEFTCDGKFEPYANQDRIVFEKLCGKKP